MLDNTINNNIDILETSFEDDKIEFDTKLILKKNYLHVIRRNLKEKSSIIKKCVLNTEDRKYGNIM